MARSNRRDRRNQLPQVHNPWQPHLLPATTIPGCARIREMHLPAALASRAAPLRTRIRRNAANQEHRNLMSQEVLAAHHRDHGLAALDMPSHPKKIRTALKKNLEQNLPKTTQLLGAPRNFKDSELWRDRGVVWRARASKSRCPGCGGGSFMPGPAKGHCGRV